MRAFFAIVPEPEIQALLAARIESMRGAPWADTVRWLPPDKIHLTLRFVAALREADVDALVARVDELTCAHRPFEILLGDTVLFPSARRPRVVVAEVAMARPLVDLAAAVDAAVVAGEQHEEPRGFRPHITLGRFRRPPPSSAAPSRTDAPTCSLRVDHFVLMQSRLDPKGAVHTPLHRFDLDLRVEQP